MIVGVIFFFGGEGEVLGGGIGYCFQVMIKNYYGVLNKNLLGINGGD